MRLRKIHASIVRLEHLVELVRHIALYAKKATIALAQFLVMKVLLMNNIYKGMEEKFCVQPEHIV